MQKNKISVNTDLLSIIDAGSITNTLAMVQILLDEKRPIYVLIDNDDTRTYNKLKQKQDHVNDPKKLLIQTISEISNDAIAIEDLLPLNIYIQSVQNYLEYLVREEVIKLKSQTQPVFNEIGTTKRSNRIAEIIAENYQSFDDTELNKKTPISKVGVAHEFEKLLANAALSTAEEKKCLDLIVKVAENLKLLSKE